MPSVRAANARSADEIDERDVQRVQRSVTLATELGNPSLLARALDLLGATLRRSDPDQALDVLRRSLNLSVDLGNEEIASFARWDLAIVLTDLGRLTETAALLLAGLGHHRQAGAHFQAWEMCMAGIRPLIKLGDNRAAALVIGRIALTTVVEDWQKWILPRDAYDQFIGTSDEPERERWMAEGAAMSRPEVVAEIAVALGRAIPSNHEGRVGD